MHLLLGLLVSAACAAGVLFGAAIVLRLRRIWPAAVPMLIAFAAGTLLGTAFWSLLPEAAESVSIETTTEFALAGVLLFLLLERGMRQSGARRPTRPPRLAAGYLLLVGDGLHNLVDGLVLGAAFAVDPALGLVTGIAVFVHEVPQEVGDFALLVEGGLSPDRALIYDLMSASTIFPGVVVGFLVGERADTVAGSALALAAGGFLYVALADLLPALDVRCRTSYFTYQLAPLLAGVALTLGLAKLTE